MIIFWGCLGRDGSIGFGINVDLASQTVEPAPEQVPEILVFAQGLSHVPASVHYREQTGGTGDFI